MTSVIIVQLRPLPRLGYLAFIWDCLSAICVMDVVGYASDPSVSVDTAPDTVIGDVEKFKEMKGFHILLAAIRGHVDEKMQLFWIS